MSSKAAALGFKISVIFPRVGEETLQSSKVRTATPSYRTNLKKDIQVTNMEHNNSQREAMTKRQAYQAKMDSIERCNELKGALQSAAVRKR